MLLESEGGIYSDLDTTALTPIDDWIPRRLKPAIRAVVGIAYDCGDGDGDGETSPGLEFSQWTMAASRGHPLMSRAIADAVEAIQTLAMETETMVADLRPSDEEVGRIGGVVWTRAVLKTLSEGTGTEVGWRNFTGMRELRVFGDVLVLPVNGFGMGRLRSGGGREGDRGALVRHGEGSRKLGWSG